MKLVFNQLSNEMFFVLQIYNRNEGNVYLGVFLFWLLFSEEEIISGEIGFIIDSYKVYCKYICFFNLFFIIKQIFIIEWIFIIILNLVIYLYLVNVNLYVCNCFEI